MKVPVALALPNGLAVAEIEMIDEVLTLTAVSVQMRPCCPLCGVCASRVHSRYIRRLTDLPSGGQRVCLLVCVRKFFCQVSTCSRKIFADLCWLLVISAHSIGPLRASSHDSRSLSIPQRTSTITMHSSASLQNGSQLLC